MSKLQDLRNRIDAGECLIKPRIDKLRATIESRPDLTIIENKVEQFQEKRHVPEVGAFLDALKENRSLLGAFIQMQLRLTMPWLIVWFAVLAFLLLLNIFIHPHHPHFVVDAYWGFWAVFGLGVGCLMVYVMKRIIQPLIVRKEDYYGDI